MRIIGLVITILSISGILFSEVLIAESQESTLINQLGWVADPACSSLCCGYYRDIPLFKPLALLSPSSHKNYHLKADRTIYSFTGSATLKGHVILRQRDSQLSASTATAVLDRKTERLKTLKLKGQVKWVEPGVVVMADRGEANVMTETVQVHKVIFRVVPAQLPRDQLPSSKLLLTQFHVLGGWGQAESARKEQAKVITLEKATYTTCPPGSSVWKLAARQIKLNLEKGQGEAKDVTLRIKKFPVFYFPYFRFPIDNKRHSGFLLPSLTISSQSGITLGIPFYWNIAPNYDMTLTPNFITQRGVLFNQLFRYLTPLHDGKLFFGFIPQDAKFARFQQTAPEQFPTDPYLQRLLDRQDWRYALSLKQQTTFSSRWSGDIHYDRVSDDSYVRDFKKNSIDSSDNQLLQQMRLKYDGDYWKLLANVEHYQTLHEVDQENVDNRYAKLPQIKLFGDWFNWGKGWGGTVESEFVRFLKNPSFEFDPNPVIGNRVYIKPALRWSKQISFVSLESYAAVQMTKYFVSSPSLEWPKTPSVVLPMLSLKGGLSFSRPITWRKNHYRQTLEPVVYYLYVPYRNQDHLPIFDTTTQAFDYDLMFRANRFSGIDRIGDANQMTFGLSTQLLDSATGEQKASAKIGQIRYFRDRSVTLCDNDTCPVNSEDQVNYSPVAVSLDYHVDAAWNTMFDFTWNPHRSHIENQRMGIQYAANHRLLNFGYDVVRDENQKNLKQTNISGYWPLNDRWSFMGRWNYNWSDQHAETYFAGIAYQSCCWAVRFIGARSFLGIDGENHSRFDKTFYIQFELKGLGSISNSDPKELLTESINGYIDHFAEGNSFS